MRWRRQAERLSRRGARGEDRFASEQLTGAARDEQVTLDVANGFGQRVHGEAGCSDLIASLNLSDGRLRQRVLMNRVGPAASLQAPRRLKRPGQTMGTAATGQPCRKAMNSAGATVPGGTLSGGTVGSAVPGSGTVASNAGSTAGTGATSKGSTMGSADAGCS
jgi:hypothetical protein